MKPSTQSIGTGTGVTVLTPPRAARIGALRYVLHHLDYTDKDVEVVGVPDPLIVGPASAVFEHGEQPDRLFPTL